MERCDQCGTKIRGSGTSTALGRRLCSGCGDELVGMTIGAMNNDLGQYIALGYSPEPGRSGGILHWIRTSLRRKDS